MENIQDLLADLFSRQRSGIKPGLERTLKLLECLNNPHLKLKCIHIAGTNGKGTCSSLLASYYKELGQKVGLYTSPHILEFNERIRINGEKIPDSYIIDIYKKIENIVEEIDATFFEITTVIAFNYFAENICDICIIETGLGGRLDCTNVINPILSVITSISIDHKEYLGNTIESIAYEKAGIIKYKTPVVLGKLPTQAQNVINEKVVSQESNIISIEVIYNNLICESENDFTAKYKFNEIEFKTNLIGEPNKLNFSIFISALKYLDIFNFDIFRKSIYNLTKNTGYFARLSVLRKNPYLIIDTAHNEEAITHNVKTITKNTDNKFTIIYTGMKDKDNLNNLRILSEIVNNFILTKTKQTRNEEIDNLIEFCKEIGINNFQEELNLELLVNNIINATDNCLIIGSFFLISEVLEIMQNNHYGSIGLDSFSKS